MKTSTKTFLLLCIFFIGQQLNAQIKITDTKIGINRANPNVAIDALGLNPDDAALLNLANSDETHQLLFFPGRLNDPNPFIQWTDSDPLRFATTQGGFTEWMRIQPDGKVGIGTNFPLELLDVDGNVKAIKFIGDGSMLTNIAQQDLSLSGDTLNLTNDATAVDLGAFINNWTLNDGRDATFGYNNVATGIESSATGNFNDAVGARSSAFGYRNEAAGIESSAIGNFNDATGLRSSAVGYINEATGDFSSAVGYINEAIGEQSSAFGHGTLSDVYGLMAVGHYNADPVGSIDTWVDTEPVFVIGNGKDFLDRSTAVTVLKNGKVGIGTSVPKQKLHVTGTYYGFGDIRLHAHDGDGNNGIAYVQARDDSGTSDLSLQFRTQNNGTIVDALKITNDGDVGIGTTTDPESKLEVVASSSSGSSNVATFRNSTSGVGSIKILGEDFSSVKFIDSGSGSVTESDFEIASIGDGRLVIRNADNANDGFGAFESIALFEPMSQTYQFVV